ncbi:MAG: hypothetical protein ACOH5I_19830 [Oligoflexus sp.]
MKTSSLTITKTLVSLSLAVLLQSQFLAAAVPAPLDPPPGSTEDIDDEEPIDDAEPAPDDTETDIEQPADDTDSDISPDDPTAGAEPSGKDSAIDHPDELGNHPSKVWYQDMYKSLNDMKKSAYQMASYSKSYEVSYYSDWLYQALDQYMNQTYVYDYNQYYPRYYSKWKYYATRGDHNYFYYYYVRPLYYQTLRELAKLPNSEAAIYQRYTRQFIKSYRYYTRCNYGHNGNDPRAAWDDEAIPFEESALH